MSWHFLQGQEAESWAASCLDGAPYALLRLLPLNAPCCLQDSGTVTCHAFPYGTTSEHLTDGRGVGALMSLVEASPAPTSVIVGTRSELRGSTADFGGTWRESLARFDHNSSSWKTSQRCLFEEWEPFSETWPGSGMMRDGMCWDVQTLADRSREKEFGLWPTLKASDAQQYSKNLNYFKRRAKIAPDLPVMVALKTSPTKEGFYGRLNPDWTEWLMGWPIGWTALKPLETDRFQEWWQAHGGL